MLNEKLEVSRFTTQTIKAGDITVEIDFRGNEITDVRATFGANKGIDAPAEVIERIATVVSEARRYGDFHGEASRAVLVCPIHGYVEHTAKSFECAKCEPQKAFNEKQAPRLVVSGVTEHEKAAALVAFALRKENVQVKSIKPAPGKDAVGFLIETPDDIWHAIPREDAPNGWRFLAVDRATLPAQA